MVAAVAEEGGGWAVVAKEGGEEEVKVEDRVGKVQPYLQWYMRLSLSTEAD